MRDNTTWLDTALLDWDKRIYTTDNPDATLAVPANRGREGMVYLTYIIDHYDSLPPVIIFQHANQYQWHNDDPLYDGLRMLERLSIPTVAREGYANLRCVWTLGCPVEIRPIEEATTRTLGIDGIPEDAKAGQYYKEAFEHLFPDVPVPEEIGLSCCAQFAVTAAKVRERPRRDYERYRRWLLETPLRDDLSGRIMEYSWHIIFGKDAVHCPDASKCYCDLFGLCALSCEEQGVCRSQYTLAKYSTLPQGWPEYDWDGDWQDVPRLRAEQELDYIGSAVEISAD
ncbi:hypothetical protein LTR62_005403 [Meristemomyces frigidus]|uniref:Uncharacterized protein n=1 Tax=Meristemomyces frigidus TaxID=1508187 RepID=A0AAN7YNK3_9PEZI|nr:hypothetical protein LTR62_005403 [Meristemomyces frigidus]